MDAHTCPECRAILSELCDAVAAVRRLQGPGMKETDLADWVRGFDEEKARSMRESSPFWEPWRRWMAHRALTGHALPFVAIPPGALLNPN